MFRERADQGSNPCPAAYVVGICNMWYAKHALETEPDLPTRGRLAPGNSDSQGPPGAKSCMDAKSVYMAMLRTSRTPGCSVDLAHRPGGRASYAPDARTVHDSTPIRVDGADKWATFLAFASTC